MSQPALSQQVAALELETGQRLLNRTGRGAEPTEAGLALLAHARGIFELAERARADMRERQLIPSGRITIGLPPRVAHAMTADLVGTTVGTLNGWRTTGRGPKASKGGEGWGVIYFVRDLEMWLSECKPWARKSIQAVA